MVSGQQSKLRLGSFLEMILAGMLGSSVIYGIDKSSAHLDRSINALISYLEELAP
jgi:hypothetical protein